MDNNADLVKFRSAVGGFNRVDVIHYIEQANLEAQQEKKALEDRAAQLEKEAKDLREETKGLREELAQLQKENKALQQTLDTATAPQPAPLTPKPTKKEPPKAEKADLSGKELAAYRRAEAVERQARKRANELYHTVSAIRADALSRLETLSGETNTAYAALAEKIAQMQQSLRQMEGLFSETETALRQLDLADPDGAAPESEEQ